jgi:16S rRNA (uracil1498-N3)-methyltransferase
MHIFYIPETESDHCNLSHEESRHCIKVLRLKPGDNIHLIDGKGGFYIAKIVKDDPNNCLVEIIKKNKDYKKRDFNLHIAISPTKNNDRFEWFIEKATEIGIDEITPMITKHSEKNKINFERLNKIIISASKQSVNPYFPALNNIKKFDEIIGKNYNCLKCLACYSNHSLKDLYTTKSNILILVGPEGDFSEKEIENAKTNNFSIISLGNNRLRTETAGIVACHTINFMNS